VSGLWGPAKGGAPPWSLGSCIGTQIKAKNVAEDEIKGLRVRGYICEFSK
jgi:hypothetical protein